MKLSDLFHSPRSGILRSAATPPPFICRVAAPFIRGVAAPFICRAAALFIALSAATSEAADAGYTLGVPGAPVLRLNASAADNAWLSANPNYPAMSVVAPGAARALSHQSIAGEERVARLKR